MVLLDLHIRFPCFRNG